jgi:hypothetical protein
MESDNYRSDNSSDIVRTIAINSNNYSLVPSAINIKSDCFSVRVFDEPVYYCFANVETSKTSCYFSKFLLVSRNRKIRNISRNSNIIGKLWLTSRYQTRVELVDFLFREKTNHAKRVVLFMKHFVCTTSLLFAKKAKWIILRNGEIEKQ